MKKKSIIAIVVLLIGIVIGVIAYGKWNSPERALVETILDVHNDGVTGLEKHLTEENIQLIESIQNISEDNIISGFLSSASADFIAQFLKSKLSEVDWSLVEVMQGKKYSEAVIRFQYKDMLSGTIGIKMEKIKGKWLISGIGNPSIEEVNWK